MMYAEHVSRSRSAAVLPHGPVEAGTHLIADFWDTRRIDSVVALERIVRDAVAAAEATLLELRFHAFAGHGGITGFALLAESHISIHTWPERGYVAIDIFMCGEHRPHDSLGVLRKAFRPAHEQVRSIDRGVRPTVASQVVAESTTSAKGSGGRKALSLP